MSLSAKLIWRDICSNKGRMAVSVFAIFVSISLIVWTMGSYDTLVEEFDNDAENPKHNTITTASNDVARTFFK